MLLYNKFHGFLSKTLMTHSLNNLSNNPLTNKNFYGILISSKSLSLQFSPYRITNSLSGKEKKARNARLPCPFALPVCPARLPCPFALPVCPARLPCPRIEKGGVEKIINSPDRSQAKEKKDSTPSSCSTLVRYYQRKFRML
jgi:hypothetical protein